MHTKRFNTSFKRWVQFRVGAIPRLPVNTETTKLDLLDSLLTRGY